MPALWCEATAEAGPEGVKRVIGRRFELFPQPQRSDLEWSAWWSDYFDVLAEIPEPAIEAGMRAWVRDPDAEFMPKPGKLLELAKTTPNPAVATYERAQRILTPDPEPSPYRPQKADEAVDPREVAELMADFRQNIAGNKMPESPRFKFKAPIDEHGISPALRDAMAKRK